MVLSQEDGKLFFRLFMPLLDFVNQKYRIRKSLLQSVNPIKPDYEALILATERLWSEVSLIDEYLNICEDMPQEHRDILCSWKRCVRGTFVLDRYRRGAGILVSAEDKKVYKVLGITSSFPEMFQHTHLPLIMDAAILPFRNVIITDGLFQTQSAVLSDRIAQEIADIYLEAKVNNTIIEKL